MNIRELDLKKVGMIAGLVLVTLVFAYFIYALFFASDDPSPEDIDVEQFFNPAALPGGGARTDTGSPTGPGGSAGGGQARDVDTTAQGSFTTVVAVSDARVLDPTPTRDGNDVSYYDPEDGHFYRLSADGQTKTLLTDEQFFSVENVIWAPDKEQAVIEYPDGSNIIYDFVRRQATSLPREVVEPVFSPGSDELVFKIDSSNPEDNWVVVTDSRTGSTQLIEPVGDNGDEVQTVFSPDEQVVAIYHTPVGPNQEEIFFIGKQGENFKSMIVNGLNFKGIYTPDGTRIVYHVISTVNGYRPELWVADAKGANAGRNMFNLTLHTWIDKCTISTDARIVYCAVPKDTSNGAGLSSRSMMQTNDIFYRIDLDTGLKRIVAIPSTQQGDVNVSVTLLWLDAGERHLFFHDAYTNKIYKIQLK